MEPLSIIRSRKRALARTELPKEGFRGTALALGGMQRRASMTLTSYLPRVTFFVTLPALS